MPFPKDLVAEILSRLPVKSVVRFRCVCKSWYNLTSTKEFIFLHLKNYNSSSFLVAGLSPTTSSIPSKNNNLVGSNCIDLKISILIVSPPSSDYAAESDIPIVMTLPRMIKFPPSPNKNGRTSGFYPKLCGPCNGILCLHSMSADNIVLWNPSIQDFKIIPKSNLPRLKMDNFCTVGFGFDDKEDDYKIMQIVLNRCIKQLHIELYSHRTNSWRKLDASIIEGCTFHSYSPKFTTNRKLGWFVCDTNIPTQYQMLLFDVGSETFEVIPVTLDDEPIKETDNISVFPFKDSVAIVIPRRTPFCGRGRYMEVWVLDGFGSTESRSWTRMWKIQHQKMQKPLGFWGDRHLVFQHKESGKLMLYDLLNWNIVDLGVEVDGAPILTTLVYRESLVTISDPKEKKNNGITWGDDLSLGLPDMCPPHHVHERDETRNLYWKLPHHALSFLLGNS